MEVKLCIDGDDALLNKQIRCKEALVAGLRGKKSRGKAFGGRKKPRLDFHRAITDFNFGRTVERAKKGELCEICGEVHTKNVHRFHGKGSFCRTHRGHSTCN